MHYDVTAIGELLMDFTQNGVSPLGNRIFEANPGGAPCNVLAMLQKLGKSTAFLGKIGDDIFGKSLTEVVSQTGIDLTGLVVDAYARTTLAFVQNTPDGDRDFSFYRNPGADQRLTPEEVCIDIIRQSRIFHFGTLSLTDEPSRSATQLAVNTAADAGVTISFDPNLRLPIWSSPAKAREQMLWGCGKCRILKLAEEELSFLTGKEDIRTGVVALRSQFPNIHLILVTKGKNGAEAFLRNWHVCVPAFLSVKTIDTTGAGDTFLGSCFFYLLEHNLELFAEEQLLEMIRFASAAAALVTTHKGAICAMPTRLEIEGLLRHIC